MKTKIFCLLIAVFGAIAMLASCGGNPGERWEPPIGLEPPVEGYHFYWDNTDLIFQLTNNSNSNELSSTLKRYLAGEDYAISGGDIDDAVAARNAKSYADTKVTVKYDYLDNTADYVWGRNVDRIFTQVNSGATGTPDMYCNFAYDMTCVSLKNAFANLYSTAYGQGMNFFRFIAEDYKGTGENFFDSEAGEGYFFDYMKSLTLSDDKAYCLASNYCIDMVRAFLVVPVNIDMMNQIAVGDSTGDKGIMDGKFDISDFYELVWDGDFTYDALATLAEAVYSPESDFNIGADLGDILGFAAGTQSGLTSSGLLYTTDVKIIDKAAKGDGTYKLTYPETNEKFVTFGEALTDLFQKTGICAVNRDDANGALGTSGLTELECIRNSFTANRLLFGGIISVGSLEDVAYQEMRLGSGFGIAPVPLYEASTDETPYLTLVHNIARIIAISRNTTKFEQCSAFLNAQSVRSAEVITTYYEEQLTTQVAVGEAANDNVKMLTYIRNNVRDCFDKTFEDVISNYYADQDSQAMSNRWHGILQEHDFQVTNIRTMYTELRSNKQKSLENLLTEWNRLP